MRQRRGGRIGRIVGMGLLVAALVKERRTPAEQRTGQGRVAGLVPYDLRRPTLSRYRDALWNADRPLLVGSPFGVGWTFNAGRLASTLRGRG